MPEVRLRAVPKPLHGAHERQVRVVDLPRRGDGAEAEIVRCAHGSDVEEHALGRDTRGVEVNGDVVLLRAVDVVADAPGEVTVSAALRRRVGVAAVVEVVEGRAVRLRGAVRPERREEGDGEGAEAVEGLRALKEREVGDPAGGEVRELEVDRSADAVALIRDPARAEEEKGGKASGGQLVIIMSGNHNKMRLRAIADD